MGNPFAAAAGRDDAEVFHIGERGTVNGERLNGGRCLNDVLCYRHLLFIDNFPKT